MIAFGVGQERQSVGFSESAYPCYARAVDGGRIHLSVSFDGERPQTHYVFVTTFAKVIFFIGGQPWPFDLFPGSWAVLPGGCFLVGAHGVVITRIGYVGLLGFGGPIEPIGRLRYIDGCTDTVLASPPRKGDPVLNHLHFPPHIDQTMHVHPSERIGIICKGSGICKTPDGDIPLLPGMCWALEPGSIHGFKTTDQGMDVIAWHPETDAGPTDEDHFMLNRTIVDGESAKNILGIHTGKGVEVQS